MKKSTRIFIVLIVIFATIFAVVNLFIYPKKYNPVVNIESNYNNISFLFSSDIWANNEFFYIEHYDGITRWDKAGNVEVIASVHTLREKEKFLSDNESGTDGGVQAFGNYIYFWYETSNAIYEFYRVDKNTLKQEKIYTSLDYIYSWTVLDNQLIFNSKTVDLGELKFDLQILNFDNKKVRKIDSNVISFGIVDKKIRYVKHNRKNKSTKLFEYSIQDKSKELLGEFSGNSYNCWDFNYTDDKLILFKRKTIFVYDIFSGMISEYKFNRRIENMSCFGNSAFIEIALKHGQSDIYHLDISNGKTTKLYSSIYCYGIYCVNEDNVFVIDDPGSPTIIRRINKNGEKDIVLVLD